MDRQGVKLSQHGFVRLRLRYLTVHFELAAVFEKRFNTLHEDLLHSLWRQDWRNWLLEPGLSHVVGVGRALRLVLKSCFDVLLGVYC